MDDKIVLSHFSAKETQHSIRVAGMRSSGDPPGPPNSGAKRVLSLLISLAERKLAPVSVIALAHRK